jgi:hypothetical protein
MMQGNNTPRTETITLAAGAAVTVPIPGRWMQVMDCTVAAFEYAFDNDTWTPGEAHVTYPAAEGFQQVRFRDSGGLGCTIRCIISQNLPSDNRYGVDQLVAIAASVAAIDIDTDNLALIEAETANLDVPLSDVTALLTTIETETANLDTPLSTIEAETANLDVPLSDVTALLTTIEAETANLDVAISDTMIPLSTGGGAGQIALTVSGGATPNGGGPNQAMREIQFWTAGALVYCTIDAAVGNAANTHFLMIPNHEYTFPVANGEIVRFHNDDAANAVIIYHIWRN